MLLNSSIVTERNFNINVNKTFDSDDKLERIQSRAMNYNLCLEPSNIEHCLVDVHCYLLGNTLEHDGRNIYTQVS